MPARPLPHDDLRAVLTRAHGPLISLRNANLFITGGTGFFGHWLLESLLHANAELDLSVRATVLTRNAAAFHARSPHIADNCAITLLEGDTKTFAFPTLPHSHIVHAATDTVAADGPALAESVLAGTRHVLDFARHTGAYRLLYTSTGAVYGRSAPIACTRETLLGTGPSDPPDSYEAAKRASELLCMEHCATGPLECVVARCFAFVGPHLPLGRHFAIGNFIRDALAGTPIHIRGDGTPLRSFLYMSDLAVWLWTMLASAPANRAYNVGSDEAVSIGELARLTAATLKPSLAIQIDGTPQPGVAPASYVPDISRARSELGLDVTIRLAEAIRRTAAWHGFRN